MLLSLFVNIHKSNFFQVSSLLYTILRGSSNALCNKVNIQLDSIHNDIHLTYQEKFSEKGIGI